MKTQANCKPLAWALGIFLWTVVLVQTVNAQITGFTGPLVNWADWTSYAVANPNGSATHLLPTCELKIRNYRAESQLRQGYVERNPTAGRLTGTVAYE